MRFDDEESEVGGACWDAEEQVVELDIAGDEGDAASLDW